MPPPSPDRAPVERTMPALTGLRGIVAAWVVLFHLSQVGRPIGRVAVPGLRAVVEHGWIGVDIFFMLSGFVLLHAHGREVATRPLAAVPGFLAARFWRVYPLNAAVLALIAAVVVADPGFAAAVRGAEPADLGPAAWVRALTISTRWFGDAPGNCNEPIWSLSVEIIGYAVFPVVAWLAMRLGEMRQALIAALACIALWLAIQIGLGQLGTNLIRGGPSVWRMACMFAAGVALYRARRLAPAAAVRWSGAVGVAAMAGAVPLLAGDATLMPFAAAGTIWTLSFGHGRLARLLRTRVAMFLGRISFPLYLLHLMALRWIISLLNRAGTVSPLVDVAALVAGVAAIVAASWLLHRLVERPSARRAHRIAPARDMTTATLPGRAAVAAS